MKLGLGPSCIPWRQRQPVPAPQAKAVLLRWPQSSGPLVLSTAGHGCGQEGSVPGWCPLALPLPRPGVPRPCPRPALGSGPPQWRDEQPDPPKMTLLVQAWLPADGNRLGVEEFLQIGRRPLTQILGWSSPGLCFSTPRAQPPEDACFLSQGTLVGSAEPRTRWGSLRRWAHSCRCNLTGGCTRPLTPTEPQPPPQ